MIFVPIRAATLERALVMDNPELIARGRLQGKATLVTGAASGIGRATALLFAREGARVALGDLDSVGAEKVASRMRQDSHECLVLPLDVTSEDSWASGTKTILDTWTSLDVLINCAGICDDAPLTTLTVAQWRRVLAVNLDGTFLGTAAAIRAMSLQGQGSIVNVSSLSGVKACAGAAAYCASKAGVIQLSRVAALECADAGDNIRVNCVVPGGVKTPMWKTSSMWPEIATTEEWNAPPSVPPLKRFADPAEVARAILFLASDESSYISGAALAVDGGASA